MYPNANINAAMGERRLTNEQVAAKAKVTRKVVSAVRNGKVNITLPSLKKVANAVGLELVIQLVPKAESDKVEEPATT